MSFFTNVSRFKSTALPTPVGNPPSPIGTPANTSAKKSDSRNLSNMCNPPIWRAVPPKA